MYEAKMAKGIKIEKAFLGKQLEPGPSSFVCTKVGAVKFKSRSRCLYWVGKCEVPIENSNTLLAGRSLVAEFYKSAPLSHNSFSESKLSCIGFSEIQYTVTEPCVHLVALLSPKPLLRTWKWVLSARSSPMFPMRTFPDPLALFPTWLCCPRKQSLSCSLQSLSLIWVVPPPSFSLWRDLETMHSLSESCRMNWMKAI